MANIKISDLVAKTNPAATDVLPLEGSGLTNKVEASILVSDTPFVLPGATAARSNAEMWGDSLNVKSFGAAGDNATDDTAAIQAAEDYSYNNPISTGVYRPLYFPAGKYKCNSLTWRRSAMWYGDGVGTSRLIFNGANAAGTYIVGIAASSGAVAFSGFDGLTLDGFGGELTDNIAESCIVNLGTGLDWGFKVENVNLRNVYGDAFKVSQEERFLNLYINRIRFDGVGGHGLTITGGASNSGTPIVLSQFTYDNVMLGNFATRAQALGYYNGTKWGKGVMAVADGRNLNILICDARLEINKKVNNDASGGRSLFYCNNGIAGSETLFAFRNITGTGPTGQELALLRSVNNRVRYSLSEVNISDVSRYFACDSDSTLDVGGNNDRPLVSGRGNLQRAQGIIVGGQSFESRAQSPSQYSVYTRHRGGDLVFGKDHSVGRPVAWSCRFPSTGFAVVVDVALSGNVVVTAGSDVVTGLSATHLNNLAPGIAITLPGAGVGGVDLDCRVVSVDSDAATMVVTPAASTTVNPGTVKYDKAEFAPILYVPGVSANRGNASVSLALGIDAPTQYFNSALTADRTVALTAASAAWLDTPTRANGGKFRIVRSAASTGAFNLDVGGLKNLATGQWCDVEWNGSAWILTGFGAL